MSTRFNPYVEWLNIDCPTGKPTYYELLNISPAETDLRKVESAARTQLGKLNTVKAGAEQKRLDSLKAEIKKAFSVISNSAQRAKYDKKLRANPRPESAPKTDMMPPKKVAATKPKADQRGEERGEKKPPKKTDNRKSKVHKRSVNQDLLPPSKASDTDMLPPGAKPIPVAKQPVEQLDPPKAKRVSDLDPPIAKSAIPVAKAATSAQGSRQVSVPAKATQSSQLQTAQAPIAKAASVQPNSKDRASIPSATPAATPAATPVASQVSGAANSTDPPRQSTLDSSRDNGSQPQNRSADPSGKSVFVDVENSGSEKRNLLLPILAVGFSAVVVGGAIYGMGLLKTGEGTASKSDDWEIRGGQDIDKPEVPWQRHPSDRESNLKQSIDHESDQVSSESSGESNRIDRSSSTDLETNKEPDRPPAVDNVENSGTDVGTTGQQPKPQVRLGPTELLQPIFQADIVDQRQLQNQMFAISSLWLLQDYRELAETRLSIDSGEHTEAIRELNFGLQQVSERLEEFWRQFAKSCAENQGDIEIDGRIVGFVEAAPNHLTLKIAGTNRRYDYRFVPPGLMMAIIDRNAIEDIPTFRLQKAAYLISRMRERPDLATDIEELLRLSEADGHDVYHLRLISQFPFWMFAEPSTRPTFQSKTEYFKSYAATQGFESANEVDVASAAKMAQILWQQSADLTADDIFVSGIQVESSQEQGRRLEMLDVARQLAIRAGKPLLAMDLTYLLEYNAGKIQGDLQFDTLLTLAPRVANDVDAANWYCDSVLTYLRENEQSLRQFNARQLGAAARKVSRKFKLQAFEIQIQAKIDSFE